MIAEIKHKVVNRNSEDQLTGNVFGALRYLPYSIVRKILKNSIEPSNIGEILPEENLFDKNDLCGEYVDFWPHYYPSRTEPDVVLNFGDVVVMIEVKYFSGESGDSQLIHEAELLMSQFGGAKDRILLLIAPADMAYGIYHKRKDEIICKFPNIKFGYIAWQRFLKSISKYSVSSLICSDIADLLQEKGFDGFKGFDMMNVEMMTVFKTVRDAHKNVEMFISRCIELSEFKKEFKLAPMTGNVKFLRWNTDKDYRGWSYLSFIVVFQSVKDKKIQSSDWRNGSLYVLQISFEYDIYDEPFANITRFDYDSIDDWTPLSPSEHWAFYDPLFCNLIDYKQVENKYSGHPEAPLDKYYDLKSVIGYELPLSKITTDNVYEQIFGRFRELRQVNDSKIWI